MATRTPDNEPIDRQETVVTHEQVATRPMAPVEVATPVTPVEVATPVASVDAHRQRVHVDYAAERQTALNRAGRLISFLFGVIIALIGIRVLLRLIAANPDNPFAQFISTASGPFVAPFLTLTATPVYGGAAIEVSSLIAMLVYALLGWALVKLLWLIFYRPATRSVSTHSYHQE
jgi:uncharacterized protein YggT (Ycf19 family)